MHRQALRWTFMPTPLTRISARRRKSWERRLDYDEENQINQGKQKYYAESACPILLQAKSTTGFVEKLILKINALPADKKTNFSPDEICLMRTTVNQLRNGRLSKGQYTDAADDMLLKLF